MRTVLGAAFLILLNWVSIGLAQAPESPSVSPEATTNLAVAEGVIATGVENLTPQGAGDSFEAGVGKLYTFTKISGAQEETSIKHLWFHGDQLMAEVELPVKSSIWRTYSSKTITPDMTGEWKVDVTAQDGTVLTSIPFTVR